MTFRNAKPFFVLIACVATLGMSGCKGCLSAPAEKLNENEQNIDCVQSCKNGYRTCYDEQRQAHGVCVAEVDNRCRQTCDCTASALEDQARRPPRTRQDCNDQCNRCKDGDKTKCADTLDQQVKKCIASDAECKAACSP